jgi:hypothetical protein
MFLAEMWGPKQELQEVEVIFSAWPGRQETHFNLPRAGASGKMRGFPERWMSGLSRTPGKRV